MTSAPLPVTALTSASTFIEALRIAAKLWLTGREAAIAAASEVWTKWRRFMAMAPFFGAAMRVRYRTSFEYSLVQEIDGRYEMGSRVKSACNFWAAHVIDDRPLCIWTPPV